MKLCPTCKVLKPQEAFSRKASIARWEAAHPDHRTVKDHSCRARKLGTQGRFTVSEWQELKARYKYTCLCCEKPEPEIKLSVDHVIPLTKGGSNSIDNIQPLCLKCNQLKRNRYIDYRPMINE